MKQFLTAVLVAAFMAATIQPAQAHAGPVTRDATFYSCGFAYSSDHGVNWAQAATSEGPYVGCLALEATIVFFNGTYWTSCTARVTTLGTATIHNSDTDCEQPMTSFAKSTHRVKAKKPNGTKLWSPYYEIYH